MAVARMVHLVTVPGSFEARVMTARLGADGIVCELRGSVEGPLAFGAVQVLVGEDDLELASHLLLLDEADLALEQADVDDVEPPDTPLRLRDVALIALVLLGVALFVLARTGAHV